ncbi:GNAT family N-acetyltransferase [Acuticoccus sediminis]|uniref:GNAT family N-acetyltransferase n=1 Tax=Acuticoccus sediminis TaxID=2184697 RepID=A0A8B2NZ34_9HYPH|nr:GNAT family N-acetyltransferase [Acuticoccus sediminis]RAI03990.1 GNAT family N-acetyltransferase [Acuticoccus sediminis]
MPDDLAGLVLRAADIGDADALNRLTNLPGVRYGTLRMPFTPLSATRTMLANEDPNVHRIVAIMGCKLVGIVTLFRGVDRTAHKAGIGICVHDAFTGRGVGNALMAAATDLADNWLGLRRLELDVSVDNAAAIHLYEKHGFEHEGVKRADSLRGGMLEDVLMMGRLRDAPPRQSPEGAR